MRRLEHKQRDRREMKDETNTSRRRNTQIHLEEDIQIKNTRQGQGISEIYLQREYSGLSTRYLVGISADKLLATFR
jgi:hypothetical protein